MLKVKCMAFYKKLICKNCGYEWEYKGNSEFYTSCPKCLYRVRIKRNLLTIEGIRELLRKKKRGEPLPETWKEDVKKYIEIKEKAVNSFNRSFDKIQLQEAKNILRILEEGCKNG